jgi:hypothetical protein
LLDMSEDLYPIAVGRDQGDAAESNVKRVASRIDAERESAMPRPRADGGLRAGAFET